MTEKQVGFLYKSAATLASNSKENSHLQLLRSYYLMRCKEITKGYGLPQQQFSIKNRCLYCCLEWTNKTETKVKPLQLSKRQRRRIKKKKKKTDLLNCNKLEQICAFCKNNNVMTISKPTKEGKEIIKEAVNTKILTPNRSLEKTDSLEPVQKRKKCLNVYSKTKDVFLLSNKNNILPSTINKVPKIIKNNKKKKDKFAGLCKQAVLASSKLKEKKDKQDKLSLFLKQCL